MEGGPGYLGKISDAWENLPHPSIFYWKVENNFPKKLFDGIETVELSFKLFFVFIFPARTVANRKVQNRMLLLFPQRQISYQVIFK
jgi:hypothetical protein